MKNLTAQIANHLRSVYTGGNWTFSNLEDTLADVTWKEATTKVYDLNTIATLVYHMTYYVHEVLKVLHGAPLKASDKYSFDHPAINGQSDWNTMLEGIWKDAEEFASMVEALPVERLEENIDDPKYGNYYRNLHGIIEHFHYHLGQIVVIKKIIRTTHK